MSSMIAFDCGCLSGAEGSSLRRKHPHPQLGMAAQVPQGYTPPPQYTSIHRAQNPRSSNDRLPAQGDGPAQRHSPDHIPRSHERLHFRPAHRGSEVDQGSLSPSEISGDPLPMSEHSHHSSHSSHSPAANNSRGKRRRKRLAPSDQRDQGTNTDLSSNGQ